MVEIYTDGASRKNGGDSVWAFIIVDNNKIIYKDSGYIGKASNNLTEYIAIYKALKHVHKYYINSHIKLYSDSALAINQINGNWKTNKSHLLEIQKKIHDLTSNFRSVIYEWKSRNNSYISFCDRICNELLDNLGKDNLGNQFEVFHDDFSPKCRDMKIYDEKGNPVGIYEIAEFWIETYPEDIFISEPKEVVEIRNQFKKILEKRKKK